ncbi:MAG: SLBB domain-containing protein [Candidatus Marinimicrobia bacterium]|nr:SLBB domain-containing protein [Candidatus Neomarinimicrobiota bacterium]
MVFYRYIITLIIIFSIVGTASGQIKVGSSSSYPRSGERYITDEDGIIKMWVNVWGQVNKPGSYLVYDGIDLATLLSITGGPKSGANLKKIRLFRELPDANGQLSLAIDLKKFLKSGDRGDFTRVLPNDTFVVPQSLGSYLISNLNIVNTLLNFYNLYTIAKLRQEQSDYYDNQ